VTRLKIVSSGQTGVDRAALDFGLALGLAVDGWCPKGRRAEDGVIPDRYLLTETPECNDQVRTRRNIKESDGTSILNQGQLDGGTAPTVAHVRPSGRRVCSWRWRRGWNSRRSVAGWMNPA
jgi:hypothetical protein